MLTADLEHMTGRWGTPGEVWRRAIPFLILQPRFRGVLMLRVAQRCWPHRSTRVFARYLQGRILRSCGAEIHPAARIGPGLCFVHTTGIVIGHEVTIGSRLVIHQNVTIGHGSSPGQATIGDNVRIGAGAVLLGGITVGDGARIGANTVVLADVPAGGRAVGVWR